MNWDLYRASDNKQYRFSCSKLSYDQTIFYEFICQQLCAIWPVKSPLKLPSKICFNLPMKFHFTWTSSLVWARCKGQKVVTTPIFTLRAISNVRIWHNLYVKITFNIHVHFHMPYKVMYCTCTYTVYMMCLYK